MNFSYDGSKFNGYQKQDNALTVQGNLEDLLSRRFTKEIKIYGSGRTDKGVHAINQYAHFDADKVEIDKLISYLNEQIDGIFVKSIRVVDDEFHARFNGKKKTYKYVINVEDYDVFRRNYELEYCKSLDLDKMKELIPLLKGKHDFENFTTIQDKKESYVREIFDIKMGPWDSLGKNTGVGCHFLRQCMKVRGWGRVAWSCPTLGDPMDCGLPGSSVHGIFQARVLEWGNIAFSKKVV